MKCLLPLVVNLVLLSAAAFAEENLINRYPNPRYQPDVCGAFDVNNAVNQQPVYYLCDPHYNLNRDETRKWLQAFQSQSINVTIPTTSTTAANTTAVVYDATTMHPTLGVAVLPWDATLSDTLPQYAAAQFHKQWDLGDAGLLILLVKPPVSSYYQQSMLRQKRPKVAVSVGTVLHWALGEEVIHQALTQMQTVLNECNRRRGGARCFDVALAQGIPVLTRALMASNHSISEGRQSTPASLQITPWYVIVLKSLMGFPVLGILVICCLCHCLFGGPSHDNSDMCHIGTMSKQQPSRPPSIRSISSYYWPGMTACVQLGRVQVGAFHAESCPVCLEDFQQVSVIQPRRAPHPIARLRDEIRGNATRFLQAARATLYYLVCGQQRSPLRTLPCGHLVCQDCWHKLLEATGNGGEDDKNDVVTCPVCRQKNDKAASRTVPSQVIPWVEADPVVDPLQIMSSSPIRPISQPINTGMPPRASLPALPAANSQRTRLLPRYDGAPAPMIAPTVLSPLEMWYSDREEECLPLLV